MPPIFSVRSLTYIDAYPIIEIMSRNYVVSCIMDVVKLDMVLEKSAAKAAVAEISMK